MWFIFLDPIPPSANALIDAIAGRYNAERLVDEIQILGLPIP